MTSGSRPTRSPALRCSSLPVSNRRLVDLAVLAVPQAAALGVGAAGGEQDDSVHKGPDDADEEQRREELGDGDAGVAGVETPDAEGEHDLQDSGGDPVLVGV